MPERHASSEAVAARDANEPLAWDVPNAAGRRVRVLLPLPLRDAFDYRVPDGMPPPEAGHFVRVPLGSRNLVGVVLNATKEGSNYGTYYYQRYGKNGKDEERAQ